MVLHCNAVEISATHWDCCCIGFKLGLNLGFKISGQFFLVHDNYDLVLLSHFTYPRRKLLRTSGFISGNSVIKMHWAIYWVTMKANLFKTKAILNLIKGSSTRCCFFFQNPLCQNLTVPPSSKTTTTSSKESTTSAKPTSRPPTIVPTKPFSNVTLEVSGKAKSVILSKLKHFSDYAITVSSA